MAKANVIVQKIASIRPLSPSPQPAREIARRIEFHTGESAHLDAAHPNAMVYAEILDQLHRNDAPVYVELHPQTSTISRLLVPLSVKVIDVKQDPRGDLNVALEISHKLHVLHRTNPDFDALALALLRAHAGGTPVAVT